MGFSRTASLPVVAARPPLHPPVGYPTPHPHPPPPPAAVEGVDDAALVPAEAGSVTVRAWLRVVPRLLLLGYQVRPALRPGLLLHWSVPAGPGGQHCWVCVDSAQRCLLLPLFDLHELCFCNLAPALTCRWM